MAKQKITVTVDAELVAAIRDDDAPSLSAVVNAALAEEVARRARLRALRQLVADLQARYGAVPADDAAWAAGLFDAVDGVTVAAPA
ncbi:MAG: type II toxin-antitoxin system CcdA family antitoxin [Ilumatobacteraceae bacterium]